MHDKEIEFIPRRLGQVGNFRILESDIGEIHYEEVKLKQNAGVRNMIVYFPNVYDPDEDRKQVYEKLDRFKRFSGEVMARASQRA